jgi:hypothetical protein
MKIITNLLNKIIAAIRYRKIEIILITSWILVILVGTYLLIQDHNKNAVIGQSNEVLIISVCMILLVAIPVVIDYIYWMVTYSDQY